MACIEIKGLNGDVKTIPEGTEYPRGWTFTGKIAMDCGPQAEYSGPSVQAKLEAEGVPWGDAIAWVTKKAGFTQCPPCKARQEILNHANQNGWLETIRQIKETFK